tara:strand:+ start:300 stop:695 length:396 start_codon:yes stop_codon:yes gene_type:complete
MSININYIYNKQNLINPLIKGKNAILFELLEIVILLFLIIYYSNKSYILSIIFVIPFIEHIRQIIYKYRQAPNSNIDKSTLFFELAIFVYSIYNKYWISSIVSLTGVLIHLFQIITKRNWIEIVSYTDFIF